MLRCDFALLDPELAILFSTDRGPSAPTMFGWAKGLADRFGHSDGRTTGSIIALSNYLAQHHGNTENLFTDMEASVDYASKMDEVNTIDQRFGSTSFQ